jgi:hypothetical protein
VFLNLHDAVAHNLRAALGDGTFGVHMNSHSSDENEELVGVVLYDEGSRVRPREWCTHLDSSSVADIHLSTSDTAFGCRGRPRSGAASKFEWSANV